MPAIKLKPTNIFQRRASHTLAKAITYTQNGDPSQVLKLTRFSLGPPQPNELGLKFKLSTLNTIQGRYPWKPEIREDLVPGEQLFVCGNEGLAEVTSLGAQLDPNLWKIGDWGWFRVSLTSITRRRKPNKQELTRSFHLPPVLRPHPHNGKVLMGKPQLGTWQSHTNLAVQDVVKLPRSQRLTETQAATMSVNLSTAYRMLKDYLPRPPSPDTWIIQNGANSSVGQYVLQLCKAWDLGCIGLIRDRPNVEELKADLTRLGSENKTSILTYDELAHRPKPPESVPISLGLNCVSGNAETVGMMKWMAKGSRLITYGGMSMKPLVVPTSMLIFRDLKLEGFMLTTWRMQASPNEYRNMLEELVALVDQGRLVRHNHTTIVDVDAEHGENVVRETVKQTMNGRAGKKFLFRFI